MDNSRDSSISSTARSPRSMSPKRFGKSNGEIPQSTERLGSSPLRMQHLVHQLIDSGVAVNGDGARATTSGSVKFADDTDGFPFHTPTGHVPSGGNGSTGLTVYGDQENHHGRRASDGAVGQSGEISEVPAMRTIEAGTSTPPGRRSVQFARPALPTEHSDTWHSRSGSWDTDDDEIPGRDRKAHSIFSKLRAIAGSSGSQSHGRSQSGFTMGGDSINEHTPTGPRSPTCERDEPRYPDTLEEEGSEADADTEESAGDPRGNDPKSRKRRKRSKRPQDAEPQTAPTTPRALNDRESRFGFMSPFVSSPTEGQRPSFLPRRATMTDISERSRQGVSEDEGRDRLSKESPWRKGSAWVHSGRGLSYGGRRQDSQGTPEGRRPSNFRRLTGFGAATEGTDGTPSPWRHRAERTSSVSAQKWRQLKAGLKMIGQKRKEENKIDNAKSAELLAELTAGVPAALIMASMFQRDEHGHKRIPVLLEQLKVRLTDSRKFDSKQLGDRHVIFRIELEYGSGLTRMKWVIHRALRDFANLHLKYKLQSGSEKYIQFKGEGSSRQKIPHFPRTAFPYLKGARGLGSDEEGEEDDLVGEETGPSAGEGAASGTERPGKRKKRRPSLNVMRRRSSVGPQAGDLTPGTVAGGSMSGPATRKDTYPERQRKKLEYYLQQMIRYLIFRADSNRLCKFLELSALGVRLAAESSYHGKEGFLVIKSGKGLDFRRAWTPALLASRHSPKWFLVRHSYVVCVDSPEEMNIYDVFLVDSDFSIQTAKKGLGQQKPKDLAKTAKESATHPQHHSLKLRNSERKLKLLAKNERQLHQFEDSIRFMATSTPWAKANRFNSFAPVRPGVFAQWLVDGRDYMWNVSRAISMARDVIYIHDWWLSPELYMRRPAAISQKWRLDRLLQRKAQEGVKVFVIMYRNINSAIPIDSEYTKFSLLDLHPNVFVQRSPNQFRQNTFFWAHHEKICIVDHTVAFVGGIDLCFGRWDTPQHTVVDDKPTGFELSDLPRDADHCQLWPGKDYSNPRVQDFYALDKPYEEMYDRTKVQRMPWHDISMQVVGQPARDLTRHFVQRWNYILRQRKPTRPTPFLLPPPDFNPADLESLGLDGTCEVQILRSACWWSIGTPDKTEHSIMNAYIKMIEQSEHFVYIENQFFVSSCEVEGTRIENLIGDALVERIVRAHQNSEDWRAIIVIPLMPGFQNTVDSQDGTSVRLIMQCQYRSICRGEFSIFGRLREQDIEPEDYIQFYSLRTWGKIGPTKQLVTEQLYIHAKCMVVDDRIAIIGSANINERSMLGTRDSECAAVVRDTDMLWSTMNGEPYLVGRFPHTLRMRLMREHLGLDVDEIMEDDQREEAERQNDKWEREMESFHGEDTESSAEISPDDRATEERLLQSKHKVQDEVLARSEIMHSFNYDVDWEQASNPNLKTNKKVTQDARVTGNADHERDVVGEGADHMQEEENAGFASGRDSALFDGRKEVLISNVAPEGKGTITYPKPVRHREFKQSPDRASNDSPSNIYLPPPRLPRMTTQDLGLPMLSQLPPLPATDDTDIGGPAVQRTYSRASAEILNPLIADMRRPFVDKDCMRDPLNDSFYIDTWHAIAENNTRLYRSVFRCMPDNEVKTWKEYKEYAAYSERFAQAQGGGKNKSRMQPEQPIRSGPPGQSVLSDKLTLLGSIGEKVAEAEKKIEGLVDKVPSKKDENRGMGKVEDWAAEANQLHADRQDKAAREEAEKRHANGDHPGSLNEKAARISDDAPTDFAPLHFAAAQEDPEKSQKIHTPPAPAYSEALDKNTSTQKRRRRATTRSSKREFHASDDMIDMADANDLMKMTQGHLVQWPYDWLAREEQGGNWLYSIDQIAPLEI
ncbi:MAG: Phospholipase D1 [Pycnora praestabilis]|nr:MAG: Phospholipase D1 [Pycnora praestabilis]